MSVTPELRTSARAVYRSLFRAASITFKGDDHVLNAFREKVRSEYRAGRSQRDAAAYVARIELGREIADVLRKNIVQGIKVDKDTEIGTEKTQNVANGSGVWKLRITEHTELGSNETLKSDSACESRDGKSKREASTATETLLASKSDDELENELVAYSEIEYTKLASNQEPVSTTSHTCSSELSSVSLSSVPKSPRRMNFSVLKRAHRERALIELNENDIEESFVRGTGPGGQSINKTRNNVQLLHKPTGIRVACQETRSLKQNRQIARKLLIEKLDQMVNPGTSKEDLRRAKQTERERRRKKKARKKAKEILSSTEL